MSRFTRGGTEWSARKKGGVPSQPFVRVWRERNVMFVLGQGIKCNVNGLIGLGVVVKIATDPRN